MSAASAFAGTPWTDAADAAAALAPYLKRLLERRTDLLVEIDTQWPERLLRQALAEASAVASDPRDMDHDMRALRRCKDAVHLAVAIADIARAWPLHRVTGALTDFADAALRAALAIGGDVDGDGLDDVFVGAPGYQVNDGRVSCFSGATGELLWHGQYWSDEQGGASLAVLDDLDGDAVRELLVGVPADEVLGGSTHVEGSARVLSGATGQELVSFAWFLDEALGGAQVDRCEDLDLDGRAEELRHVGGRHRRVHLRDELPAHRRARANVDVRVVERVAVGVDVVQHVRAQGCPELQRLEVIDERGERLDRVGRVVDEGLPPLRMLGEIRERAVERCGHGVEPAEQEKVTDAQGLLTRERPTIHLPVRDARHPQPERLQEASEVERCRPRWLSVEEVRLFLDERSEDSNCVNLRRPRTDRGLRSL